MNFSIASGLVHDDVIELSRSVCFSPWNRFHLDLSRPHPCIRPRRAAPLARTDFGLNAPGWLGAEAYLERMKFSEAGCASSNAATSPLRTFVH